MSLIDQAKEQMAKTVENTKENFSGIRTGRANPALLNGITVDYYGAPTPIKAVASIGGIVRNAILPGMDYEFVQEDKGSTSVDFKV